MSKAINRIRPGGRTVMVRLAHYRVRRRLDLRIWVAGYLKSLTIRGVSLPISKIQRLNRPIRRALERSRDGAR
jgi:hypothetical protein